MTKERIIEDLVEIMETDDELRLDTELDSIEEWDSLAKLSLMAYAKKEFDYNLTASQIREFVTVDDICKTLLG